MMLGFVPMWVVGSAGAIASFPVLSGIECLTILTDNDKPHPTTGKTPGQTAALECSKRWTDAGCEVRRIVPKFVGEDKPTVAADGLPPPPEPAPGTLKGQAALEAWRAECLAWRARYEASEPGKTFLKLKECVKRAGVSYQLAWSWHNSGQLDSYVIEGTATIMCELNDLIARWTRTGRHSGRRGRRK